MDKYLEPTIRIGKQGLSESQVKEIIKQLNKRKTIKIKFLKSALAETNKKELAEKIANLTSSKLVSRIGFTIILRKS